MPEGFMRGLLDRRIERVNSYFSQSFGLERAPLRTAIDRVQEVGRVSLLDVGCGTSETLRTWAERVREFADEPDRVRATGINLFDYSSIGMHAEKNRKAIESGAMDYKVGNAEHMPEIPDASMDVVLANTSVYHMDHPGAALREMDRVARPGAVLFLNAAAADQFNSSSPLMEEVFKLEDRGYTTEQRVGIAVDPKTSDYVEILFLRMEKPQQ
jgi:ubiquinone/menaquinone biosynthesis C-methylase UbiE